MPGIALFFNKVLMRGGIRARAGGDARLARRRGLPRKQQSLTSPPLYAGGLSFRWRGDGELFPVV